MATACGHPTERSLAAYVTVDRWLRVRRYRREPWRQWIRHIVENLGLFQGPDIARELCFDLWCAQSASEADHTTSLAVVRGLE